LEALGHRSIEGEDGATALAVLERDDVDVVLLDIMMPGIDGFAVLSALKARPILGTPPVIAISAAHDLDKVARAIELGAVDYLPKPFEPTILHARINQALRERHWRRQEERYVSLIESERQRSDKLLHAIMPLRAVLELKSHGRVTPRRVPDVGVLFLDVHDFSGIAAQASSEDLIGHLSHLVVTADRLSEARGIERIKVVGDALMFTAGLLQAHADPVEALLAFAEALVAEVHATRLPWSFHGGLSFGEVITGVVGETRFAFDLWGDPVNRAARLSALGGSDVLFVDERAHRALACPDGLSAAETVALKGIGETVVFTFALPGAARRHQ